MARNLKHIKGQKHTLKHKKVQEHTIYNKIHNFTKLNKVVVQEHTNNIKSSSQNCFK